MAKLYFRYGAMGASKSANALMVAHNYEEQGRKVLLMKPDTDTRWAKGEVTSRAGNMHHFCTLIPYDANILDLINQEEEIEAIIIDEAQFLSKQQVKDLACYVDEANVPAICYGLKNSSVTGKLFEGAEALLYWADSIEEIKTLCKFCQKKATQNLRLVNGKPSYDGNVVCIADTAKEDEKVSESYIPVCRHHYFHPVIK